MSFQNTPLRNAHSRAIIACSSGHQVLLPPCTWVRGYTRFCNLARDHLHGLRVSTYCILVVGWADQASLLIYMTQPTAQKKIKCTHSQNVMFVKWIHPLHLC